MTPYNWPLKKQYVSTSHPYEGSRKKTFKIKIKGAKELAVYFGIFYIHKNDVVTFKDETGKIYDKWSGRKSNFLSPVVKGSTMILEFSSRNGADYYYGFDVEKVHFRK